MGKLLCFLLLLRLVKLEVLWDQTEDVSDFLVPSAFFYNVTAYHKQNVTVASADDFVVPEGRKHNNCNNFDRKKLPNYTTHF